MTETQPLLDELDTLLERERITLLEGRLDGLAGLLAEKEDLIESLAALDIDPDQQQLEGLRGKADRNRHLMDSALRGIRSVTTRLGTMRRLRQSLETYDRSGQRTTIATGSGQVERRA